MTADVLPRRGARRRALIAGAAASAADRPHRRTFFAGHGLVAGQQGRAGSRAGSAPLRLAGGGGRLYLPLPPQGAGRALPLAAAIGWMFQSWVDGVANQTGPGFEAEKPCGRSRSGTAGRRSWLDGCKGRAPIGRWEQVRCKAMRHAPCRAATTWAAQGDCPNSSSNIKNTVHCAQPSLGTAEQATRCAAPCSIVQQSSIRL